MPLATTSLTPNAAPVAPERFELSVHVAGEAASQSVSGTQVDRGDLRECNHSTVSPRRFVRHGDVPESEIQTIARTIE